MSPCMETSAVTAAEMSSSIAGKVLEQQRLEGQAAMQLIESARQVQDSGLPRGDGTGTLVDCVV